MDDPNVPPPPPSLRGPALPPPPRSPRAPRRGPGHSGGQGGSSGSGSTGGPAVPEWFEQLAPDRVGLRLAPAQQRRSLAVATGLALFLVLIGVLAGRPVVAIGAAVIGVGFAASIRRLGVELGPSTITVRGPSMATRTLWSRTLRWGTILDVQTTATGQIWFALPGEEPLLVRAPRRHWVADDPHFDDKVATVTAWWRARRDASASVSTEVLAAGVLAAVIAERPSRGSTSAGGPGSRTGAGDDVTRHLDALAEHPGAPDTASAFPPVTLALFIAIAVIIGYLIIGSDILLLSVALLVLFRFGRDPGRPLALAAFGLLVLSGIATVLQGNPATITMSYPNQRPLAVQAGAVAGAFLVIATIFFVITERASTRAPRRRVARAVGRVDAVALAGFAPAWIRTVLPYAVVFGVATVVRIALQPLALPAAYQPLLSNLHLGTGYSVAFPSGGVPAGQYPPLASVLVAFFPLGGGTILLIVSLLTVAVVASVAHRRFGPAAGLVAGALAALLPTFWAEQLPVQLAGLAVVGGVAFAEPIRVTPRRGLAAGACLGLAVLARPDAVIAFVVVAWWLGRSRRDRPTSLVALVGAGIAVMLPWINVIWTDYGPPWLASSLGTMLNDPATSSRLEGPLGFGLSVLVFAMVAAALWSWRTRRRVLLPFFALPIATAVLALTDPVDRDLLTWSAPVAIVLTGAWLADHVRRTLGPILEPSPLPDWDATLDDVQRRLGADPAARAVAQEDEPVIDPEPEEDHLFL